MRRLLNRRRLVGLGAVVAFVLALAALGAVSRSSSSNGAGVTAASQVPYSPWYWTMAVSPTDPNVILLATSSGLYRSSDGAKTWKPTGPKNINMTSVVQSGTSMFAGGVPGLNPVARNGAGRTAPDGKGVLAVSTDEGKTWKTLHPTGLPSATIQALAVDPAKSTTLYVLLNDGRLYRSADGARSFKLTSPKIGAPPWALVVADGGSFVAGDMDSGGFASANGKTWQKTPFTDSRGTRMVMEYAVEPNDPAKVIMTSMGIEESTDAGKTWHLVLKSNVMFGPVAWAPGTSGVAYAIGFDRSFWRTADGGKTWTQISS